MRAERVVVGIERRRIEVDAIAAAIDNHRRAIVVRRHGAAIEPVEGISVTIEKGVEVGGHGGGLAEIYLLARGGGVRHAREIGFPVVIVLHAQIVEIVPRIYSRIVTV